MGLIGRLAEFNEAVQELRAAFAEHLTAKKVPTTPDEPLEVMVNRVPDIEQGGTYEWQRDPLWWDYKAIWEAEKDSISGYTIVGFTLLQDNEYSSILHYAAGSSISTQYRFKTSDGYTGATYTHIWDRSKDKQSSFGHKTRYIVTFALNSLSSVTFPNLNSLKPLGFYSKSTIPISSYTLGVYSDSGIPCEFFDIGDAATTMTAIPSDFGTNCRLLQYVNLPKTYISIGNGVFKNTVKLNTPLVGMFPEVINIGYNFLQGSGYSKPLQGLFPKAQTVGSAAFYEMFRYNQSTEGIFPLSANVDGSSFFRMAYSLNQVLVVPHTSTGVQILPVVSELVRIRGIIITSPNWGSVTSWNISYSTLWSKDTMIDMGRNLPNRIELGYGAFTLIFGSENLLKLTAEEKLTYFTSKGYTLS